MMRLDVIVTQFTDLEIVELAGWIEQGWVWPEPDGMLETIDIARVRLIYDLRRNLGVQEDAVPMVLALLDQVYDLRRTLKAVSAALDTQPPAVRDAVLAAMAGAATP
jgi:chaperone modulatory protein CbpM